MRYERRQSWSVDASSVVALVVVTGSSAMLVVRGSSSTRRDVAAAASSRSASRSTGTTGRVGDLGLLEHQGQRLAAHDLADQHRHLAGLRRLLGELVRAHAVARRRPDDVLGELLLVDRQLLLLDDLVEHELRGHRLAGALVDVGVELLLGLPLGEPGSPPCSCRRPRAGGRGSGCAPSTSALTTPSGSGTSTVASSASSTRSRAWTPCCTFFMPSSRVRTSARSSSRVSNSLAVWAKSSSSSRQLALLDRLHRRR